MYLIISLIYDLFSTFFFSFLQMNNDVTRDSFRWFLDHPAGSPSAPKMHPKCRRPLEVQKDKTCVCVCASEGHLWPEQKAFQDRGPGSGIQGKPLDGWPEPFVSWPLSGIRLCAVRGGGGGASATRCESAFAAIKAFFFLLRGPTR